MTDLENDNFTKNSQDNVTNLPPPPPRSSFPPPPPPQADEALSEPYEALSEPYKVSYDEPYEAAYDESYETFERPYEGFYEDYWEQEEEEEDWPSEGEVSRDKQSLPPPSGGMTQGMRVALVLIRPLFLVFLFLLMVNLVLLGTGLAAGIYHKDKVPLNRTAMARTLPSIRETVPDELKEVPPGAGRNKIAVGGLAPGIQTQGGRCLSIQDPDRLACVEAFFGPLPEEDLPGQFQPQGYPDLRGPYLGRGKNLDQVLEMMAGTKANAVVIDAKESYGLTYESKVPLAVKAGASIDSLSFPEICKKCHAKGVKVIARVVCFKDEILTVKEPDHCLIGPDGVPLTYGLEGDASFLNPYDQRNWTYLLDICRELIGFGIDEIQFDYVRFPTGTNNEGVTPQYGPQGTPEEAIPEKWEAINRFLETARIELQSNLGTPVGADLFSIVLSSEVDGHAIGQDWQTIGLTGLYTLSPMIYPSHYANASNTYTGNGVGSYIGEAFFERPDQEPFDVVLNALWDGAKAFRQPGYARLRPYLQAFTAEYLPQGFYMAYGPTQIQDQVRALEEYEIGGCLLWNVDFEAYTKEYFETMNTLGEPKAPKEPDASHYPGEPSPPDESEAISESQTSEESMGP